MGSLLAVALVLLLQCTSYVHAVGYAVVVEPHKSACFHEPLKRGADMGITYQVTAGGHLDIDFYVPPPLPASRC